MIEGLSPEAARTLVRALSAYMKATPSQELPSSLRAIRSFAPKALASHKKTLVAALDDESFRPRVAEWLADKQHSLSKGDAATLQLVVERPDGWEEKLRGEAPGVAPNRPHKSADRTASLEKALEREKEKVRKAREEARRAREEAASAVKAERAGRDELLGQLEALRSEVKELTRQAADAERRATKSETGSERLERKTRKEIQRLEEATEKARRELRDARKELRVAQSRVAALESANTAPKRSPRRDAPPKPKGPRKRLPFVKGLLDDDPRTLDSWLDAEDVHLLVDGYNVTKAEGGFGAIELRKQRRLLVEGVNALARKKKVKATIVFDGSEVPPGSARLAKGPAIVEYSRPDEIADDHLIALLEGLPNYPVVVVTNDRELQGRAAKLGASIAGSQLLLALMR